MKRPTLKYILWIHNGQGYTPTECATVEEALLVDKYTSDWYLTEAVNEISAYTSFSKQKEEKDT